MWHWEYFHFRTDIIIAAIISIIPSSRMRIQYQKQLWNILAMFFLCRCLCCFDGRAGVPNVYVKLSAAFTFHNSIQSCHKKPLNLYVLDTRECAFPCTARKTTGLWMHFPVELHSALKCGNHPQCLASDQGSVYLPVWLFYKTMV